jgi:hypothetical protein
MAILSTRYFLLDPPKPGMPGTLVKVEGGVGYVYRPASGQWEQSNYFGAKVSGQGGDSDCREVSTEEAQLVMRQRA